MISNECASLLESIDDVPKHILLNIQQGKKTAKYSEELRQFATTLHFYSPKAYDYVRDNFQKALPHSHTIRSWYSSVSADPGFTVASFTALKSHVEENRERERNAFDALNSRNPLGKGFKAPIKPTTKDRVETILKEAETMLRGLKVQQLAVQLVEVSVPEDDTVPVLPDVCSLSEYKEAAISYITGFVVKKMKEKITCLPCSQELTTDGAAHDFIHLKDRGGLQKPSPGMLSVCLTTEKYIQRRITTSGGQLPCGRGITLATSSEVMADCAEIDLFPELHSHMFATCVEMNHIHLLVKMASLWYCKVRFNHFARRQTEMAKQGKMVRRQLTKLIHFYGK
ncbi:DNA transposase THAP9 [Anabarilius grahami]|uniref:DNA transposase THAP9 n=1 Tax=Anabarilius grahami TaxID=495550 RepID=A0A3N0XNX9_ANAGA|nr:DNA transposase THAP9 [Anabarilius grahami]